MKFLGTDRKNVFTTDSENYLTWRILRPNPDQNYFKIRTISNGYLLTSDEFGNLFLSEKDAEEKENDLQLWFYSPSGLIRNKKNNMFLSTDFSGKVKTLEVEEKGFFNKWKLLLPNQTIQENTATIETPLGKIVLGLTDLFLTSNFNLFLSLKI
jgi:hypothetical protein